jgi:hypothetical protein
MIGRWIAVVALALLGAAGIGAVAGSFNPDHFVLTAAVFGAGTIAPLGALGWLLFVAPKSAPQDRNAAENVERRWAEQAAARAFADILALIGLGLAVISIAGIVLDTQLVLMAVVIVAMVDVALRYVVLERRDR